MANRNKINSYKDLDAWQEARKLTRITYQHVGKLPKKELFGLGSQMRRSAISVPSNIAEGFGQSTDKGKAKFYDYARGSLLELENQFVLGFDVGYFSQDVLDEVEPQIQKVHKLVNGLRRSVNG